MKKDLKVGGNGTGINREIVRTYPEPDWLLEKFQPREKTLYDWKEITRDMNTEQLIDLKKHLENEIFRKLGS